MIHVHRGQDARSGQNGVWCLTLMIRYTHTRNRSRHFILCRFKGDGAGGDERTSYTTWRSLHLDQILCRVAFYEEI